MRLATRFGPGAARDKLRALERLAGRRIRSATALRRLHEALCFLRAYPDDAGVLQAVTRELDGFGARTVRLTATARARLYDSGIAGTSLDYAFGLPMTRWLLQRFPGDVDVAWAGFSGGERLEEVLAALVTAPEAEAFTEGGLGWRAWLAAARAGRPLGDAALLLEIFRGASLPEDVRDGLFEGIGLSIRWRLRGVGSRTRAAMAWPRPSFQTAPLRRGGFDFVAEARRPLPAARPAPPALAAELIDAARAAMATRARELYTFSYPGVDDVLVADPGRGVRVALIGLAPARRLPLDVYYAFLLLKNGVPVGYGAAWGLFGTLEVAYNVFETFRQGESAFLLSQVLRVYRATLGARALVVDRYQIGHENMEALRSGAFYFYANLGFRPIDAAIRTLADEERAKIARDPAYRSPLSVLRRLARSSLVLALDGGQRPPVRVSGAAVAALVTRRIAREFGGDRAAAVRATARRVAAVLAAGEWARWPGAERRAFEEMALVAALVPGLERWPLVDRRRLAALMRAHGLPDQRRYTGLVNAHRRFRAALESLAGGVS